MSYAELDFVKRVLREDYVDFPKDFGVYDEFAQAIINSRLAGIYTVPFTVGSPCAEIPALVQWITAYLIGYKIFDERTSLEGLPADNKGTEWLEMAHSLLTGLVEGTYLLYCADGTVIEGLGSITAPRFYPDGIRDKAPSADNIPYFNREQAGNW